MKKTIAALTATILLSGSFIPTALASTYTVKSGDTLSKIAQTSSITIAKLKELNKLKNDSIFLGQVLQIPNKKKPIAPATKKQELYIVVKGDSLDKISKKFKVSLADLRKWNSLKNDTIRLGQKVIVSKASKPSDKPPEQKTDAKKPAARGTYTVQSGDSLWKIASKFGVTAAELAAANKLTKDGITAGQTLSIPHTNGSNKPKVPDVKTPAPVPMTNIEQIQSMLDEAKKHIGVPYVYSGTTPSGFDCSGFVYYVFSKSGYEITRQSSSSYFGLGQAVTEPLPGDLLFFSPSEGSKSITHMGIYLGDGQFIHANSSKGIEITSTSVNYYKTRLQGYKRLF